MSNPITLFGHTGPEVYLIGTIYDPDVDPPFTPGEAPPDGKVVPPVGSIVIDNTSVPNKYILLVVDAVDSNDGYRVTYANPQIIESGVDGGDRLVSYGNDTLMMYYDDRGTPTAMIPDSKFVLVGGNSAEYRLRKIIGGVDTIISAHVDGEGDIIGDRIPIVATSLPDVRVLSPGHTTFPIADGDFITMDIFDTAGVKTTEVRTIARRATILNDLVSSANPIVGFEGTANQMSGGDFVLFVNQNTEDLTLWLEVIYSDGTREPVVVDNINTFVYGLDEVNTNHAGTQFDIQVKHFLAADVPATIALGEGARFLLLEKTVKIVNRVFSDYTKISLFPQWDAGDAEWDLKFLGYYEARNRFEVLQPSDVAWVGDAFDGTALGQMQELVLHANILDGEGVLQTFEQELAIQVNAHDSIIPFTIAPSATSEFVYGAETAEHNRPKINYDVTRETYFVPTSAFADLAEFLDNFYTRAAPPFLAGTETEAPTPTHFVLRNPQGSVLNTVPIDITTYDQEMSLLVSGVDNSEYNDTTVIVEFLIDNSGSWSILYGVPVEIETGVWNA